MMLNMAGRAVCVLLAVLMVSAEPKREPLRCRHERCRYVGSRSEWGPYTYEVDGHTLKFFFDGVLVMDCGGASLLDSPALPSAEPALHRRVLELQYCPLPANGSLADTLAALNVTLEYSEPDLSGNDISAPNVGIRLILMPSEPPPAAKHFAGLERLTGLKIYAPNRTSPRGGFLAPLRNLRSLRMISVDLPARALDVPPPSLGDLFLKDCTGMERLPAVLQTSSTLLLLAIISKGRTIDARSAPPRLRELWLDSPATTLQLDTVPDLSVVSVTHWTEEQPAPLVRCDSLDRLYLTAPAALHLPDRWLAQCSRLNLLMIEGARNLTTLPPKLLIGASALTYFQFTGGALETLPPGLLDHAPRLFTLNLAGNHLRTLPSGMFVASRQLHTLDLTSNDLESEALQALEPLQELTRLDLRGNSRLGDVCEPGGDSPMRHLTKLIWLYLSGTRVTRICRDWRETLTSLSVLELKNTQVSQLSFEDLQFTRAGELEAVVHGPPITLLEMTREDFDKATHAQSGGAPVHFSYYYGEQQPQLECDCRMYWTRRALNLSLPALRYAGELPCADGRLLRDVPPKDMVCARPEACAAAALPAGCTCTARPAGDSASDRELVRVRCNTVSLSLPADTTERIYRMHA